MAALSSVKGHPAKLPELRIVDCIEWILEELKKIIENELYGQPVISLHESAIIYYDGETNANQERSEGVKLLIEDWREIQMVVFSMGRPLHS
jgi:hypothetical protein